MKTKYGTEDFSLDAFLTKEIIDGKNRKYDFQPIDKNFTKQNQLNLSFFNKHNNFVRPKLNKKKADYYWEKGDFYEILFMIPGNFKLKFIFDNVNLLQEIGQYEQALFFAYTGGEPANTSWSSEALKLFFSNADFQKLRNTGDPIPERETFTLYRGVSGSSIERRVSGISWTASPNIAAWYANRLGLANPAVYTVTVPNRRVLAFRLISKEFLLRLPLPHKPQKLEEMPIFYLI